MKAASFISAARVPHPLRLLLATLTVAVAAGFVQPAAAQPMGDLGPGGMPGRAGAHQMSRMLDSVNATAEQRAQIQQIMKAAHDDLKAQHEAARALHQQMEALFAAPTVDARAAEALRQQMAAQHEQASKRLLQARLDASRVLTADQRKALADRRAEWRGMMERHRAERQRLDAAPGR